MCYPSSQWERIMKIQDVFTRAYQDRLTWREAALILKVDERTIRRWKQTIEENGYEGLLDHRTRRPSDRRAPEIVRDQVLKLYKDSYRDWNVKHFHEQLAKHGISYQYTWVKNLLQGAGFVEVKSRKSKYRKKREPKPLVGMMLHIDGSKHRWIPGLSTYQDLIIVMDDANNDVYYAKLVSEENTLECMLGLRHVVKTKGVFCSLYSDRASHFFHTSTAGQKVDPSKPTQIARALSDLGIETIAAYSPQARGRSERLFETWQGRLPNELKLNGIKTIPDANRYILESFLPWFRKSLLRIPTQKGSAFTPYRGKNLDLIFCIKDQRTVNSDNTFAWGSLILQLPPSQLKISFAKCKVTVHQHLDHSITVTFGPHTIASFNPKPKNHKRTIHVLQKADILTC